MMSVLVYYMFILVCCNLSNGSEYVRYYFDYECNEPLLTNAKLTATSNLRERGPENAKLYGLNAWTASESDFDQHLIIDLGVVKNITRIATQGRAHSQEFVQEYHIAYGSNGRDFAQYKASGGEVKMFEGNHDGNTVRKNEFEVPIIAQYIRINPMRWRDKISMRVELYGCDYVADTMFFNGSSLVKVDLLRDPISSSRETIRFRFKTSSASGVMLYSRGTQGDYIALQLRDNRLLLNIDLGSGTATSLWAGSLLDDNLWHDAVLSRARRQIALSVDRVLVQARLKGDFSRLDLNRALYIGGVPNFQEGLVVIQNFTGCIENLYLNATNVIQELRKGYDRGEPFKYQKVNTLYACPEPPVVPVTFLKEGSYAKLRGFEGAGTLNISLEFRTYEKHGLLIYHEFKTGGHVKVFLEDGKVKVELFTEGSPKVRLEKFSVPSNDGRWHALRLTAAADRLALALDARPVTTTKRLRFLTGATYYIAGGKAPPRGFIGCMRKIAVDGNYRVPSDWKEGEDFCCPNEIIFDACQMIDRCNPNPCEHGGECTQTAEEFSCNCQGTGYAGAVCHTSVHPLSCTAYKNVQAVARSANIHVDVDGSGPLPAFPVVCEFYADGRVVTAVQHSCSSGVVDGYQEAGSFRQDVQYEASRAQLEALLNRSHHCWQRLEYSCRHSRLLNSPSEEGSFAPFAWWVSRGGQRMDHWAGAPPGSRMCACGVLGDCADPARWCNCDAQNHNKPDEFLTDGGEITEKEFLPVKQLRFGDTGTHLDEKEGRYTLGPLLCEGDDLFTNAVTFRISDAVISLPPFELGHSGDIYFEFKTTRENAILLHAKGPSDYIQLSLIGGDQLQFQFQAGDTPLGVSVETSSRLADDRWHSVSIERNRKEARVVVDGALKNEIRTTREQTRALQLSSNLVLGAGADHDDGFVGCMRALLLSGRPVDLRSRAKGLYGVSEGCQGKCASSPCLNNGTCLEGYDSYSCDCRWTAFKGPICADEIGVNLRPNSMVKYDFLGSWRSTIAESIRVGFTTTNPKGFLLGFYSIISGEYLTILITNSGHLSVVFDFGFERQEIVFPGKHFGLGQYHDVRLSRKNGGATMVLQVDDYESQEYHFNIKESADAQFNNIQYMYIGRNESMAEGFAGCVSRVEFDDIYPLKLLFQQDPPPNVRSLGGALHEDFCGVEPVTHRPEPIETRPPPPVDLDAEMRLHRADEAILGTVLALVFLLLLLLAALLVRALARHKGEYLTQEERGATGAPDPDTAALAAATGPRVTKRREFFI